MRARSAPAVLIALVVTVAAVAVAAGLAVLVTRGESGAPSAEIAPAVGAAQRFLDSYVDPDGRVVRRDQGGDTVSEGQAYGMLLAVAAGDRERFDSIWAWTQEHLQRPDGLLSWRWADGQVQDPESAADADLDAARALVLAGKRFGDEELSREGVRLGADVLEHETVLTGAGRVLVAGTWVEDPPYAVNPSYVSPAATSALQQASGDPRWSELEEGSRRVVQDLLADAPLPPDWAAVERDGSARATGGPDGSGVRYGYDAARLLVRHAESCIPVDRSLAAGTLAVLGERTEPAAVLDLAGSPQTGDKHPLATVALAAAHAAAGDERAARAALDAAGAQDRQHPTYYGAAWAALGRAFLTPALGASGCPPLPAPGEVAA